MLMNTVYINSLHTRLQFTMEVGNDDNRLNFLDITLIIDNKKIIFDYISQNYIFGKVPEFAFQSSSLS